MLKFRTPLQIDSFFHQIRYRDKVLAIGSCFAENITTKLQRFLYTTSCNPNGVLYNPLSILDCMKKSLDDYEYSAEDSIEDGELIHSLFHHSSHSQTDLDTLLAVLSNQQKQLKKDILSANWIIITFGTSWAYRYKKSGTIVANCHRIPAEQFDREWIDLDKAFLDFQSLIQDIRELNSTVKFIFTVSPIRHLKDGLVENQRSKSNLILLCDRLSKIGRVFYFPAYEIMMDDLRDYRFYTKDLCHPNEMAIEYIWNIFSETVLESSDQKLRKEIERIVNAADHRPRFKGGEKHGALCHNMLQRLDVLKGAVDETGRKKLVDHFQHSIDH